MVNRLLEEETVEADALPSTVQSLLAARLDSLDRLERRLLQSASVVGQTFWEGALATTAAEEGLDLGTDPRQPRGEGPARAERGKPAGRRARVRLQARPDPRRRLFDAAEVGPLPEARRGRRVHPRARRRAQRRRHRPDRRALRPRRGARIRGRARPRRARRASGARRSNRWRRPATRPPPSTRTPRRSTATPPPSRSPSRSTPAIVARIGEKQGDVALRMGRVDAAVGVWERCLDLPPRPGGPRAGRRPAPQDRRRRSGTRASGAPRSTTTSAASTCSRTARRASSSCASTRRPPPSTCTPATTCSPSTPRRRRSASPSGSTRRGRRAARTGSSAASSAGSATPRRRGRTWSARSRSPASRTAREAVRALLTLGYHLEVSEADYEGAAEAYREALEIAQEVGDLPSQVELHASLGQLAVARRRLGGGRARPTEASARLAEREGLHGKLCFPDLMRGDPQLAGGRLGRGDPVTSRRAHELGEQVGRSEVAFSALFWLAATLRDSGDLAGAETELARALDICERAGLIAQSVEAISARAVVAGAGRPRRAGAGRGRGGRAARRAAALSGRPGRHGRGRRRRRRGRRGGCAAEIEEAREPLARAGPPARRRALPDACAAGCCARADADGGRASCWMRRPRSTRSSAPGPRGAARARARSRPELACAARRAP